MKGNCWNEPCVRLLDMQNDDGGFALRGRRSSIEGTCHALSILADMHVDPAVRRAEAYLLEQQGENGTWNERSRMVEPNPLAQKDGCWLTALAMAALYKVGNDTVLRSARNSILARGGLDLGNGAKLTTLCHLLPWVGEENGEVHLRMVETALLDRITGHMEVQELISALDCLRFFGYTPADPDMAAPLELLLDLQAEDGSFGLDGRPSIHLTTQAACVLVAVSKMREMPLIHAAGRKRPLGMQYSYSNDEFLATRLNICRQ
jgi:hypothetical protein